MRKYSIPNFYIFTMFFLAFIIIPNDYYLVESCNSNNYQKETIHILYTGGASVSDSHSERQINDILSILQWVKGILSEKVESLKSEVNQLKSQVKTLQDRQNRQNSLIQNDSLPDSSKFASILQVYIKVTGRLDLFTEVDSRNIEAVKLLTSTGVDINSKDHIKGQTALIRSAISKNQNKISLELIKFLIDRGANPFMFDQDGFTFLHHLVEDGSTLTFEQFQEFTDYLILQNLTNLFNYPAKLTQLSLSSGENEMNILNYNFSTPLHLALKNVDISQSTLAKLKRNFVKLDKVDGNGRSSFQYALLGSRNENILAYIRNVEFIQDNLTLIEKELFQNIPITIKVASSPDKEAAIEIIKFLIENGANPGIQNRNEFGYNFLHFLLDENFDISVNISNFRNKIEEKKSQFKTTNAKIMSLTPSQFEKICDFLIFRNLSELFNVRGFLLSNSTYISYTPFQLAVKNLEIDKFTLKLLLENGVDFDSTNGKDQPIFLIAMLAKRSYNFLKDFATLLVPITKQKLVSQAISVADVKVLKILLDLGSNPNEINSFGENALIFAAKSIENKTVSIEILKFLIDYGANVFATNYDNENNGRLTFLHKLLDIEENNPISADQFHDLSSYLVGRNLSEIFNIKGNFSKYFENDLGFSRKISGITAIHLAARNCRIYNSTLKLLHENGVKFDVIDSKNNSVLVYALRMNKNRTVLKNFIKFGVDWKMRGFENMTILHYAVLLGSKDQVEFCLDELGIDVDVRDECCTPLQKMLYLREENVLEILKVLVTKGASLKVKAFRQGFLNQNAMEIVEDRGNDLKEKNEIIEFLKNNYE